MIRLPGLQGCENVSTDTTLRHYVQIGDLSTPVRSPEDPFGSQETFTIVRTEKVWEVWGVAVHLR